MPNITLTIPEELHIVVKKHSETNWSEIARRAIGEYAKKIELMDKLVSTSKLTEKDAKEISKKIKEEIAKRHKL